MGTWGPGDIDMVRLGTCEAFHFFFLGGRESLISRGLSRDGEAWDGMGWDGERKGIRNPLSCCGVHMGLVLLPSARCWDGVGPSQSTGMVAWPQALGRLPL